MTLIKPIEDINETDLLSLITDAVDERKTIDYKAGWSLDKPEWKDEFRRDVTSFANTSGGHIVFGMREEDGLPKELVGLDIGSPEKAKLRLSELLQSHVRPRLIGVGIQVVSLARGRSAVVIRVPRSFNQPHQVQMNHDFQFWGRNASGKYRLDVDELRIAFTLSETLAERVRTFRLNRIANVIADETPAEMVEGGKLMLHLVPASAFDPTTAYDVSRITTLINIRCSWGNARCFNFEGYLAAFNHPATSYLQVFHDGILEAVSAQLVDRDRQYLASQRYEEFLLQTLPELLAIQKELGVEPPVFVMLSLVGVEGYSFAVAGNYGRRTLQRNVVPIPAQMIDAYGIEPVEVLLPIFNRVWNTFGFRESLNFKDGKWVGQS